MKKLLLFTAFFGFGFSVQAQTTNTKMKTQTTPTQLKSSKVDTVMKTSKTESVQEMKKHTCTALCKDGKHICAHGEKGHECSKDCAGMNGDGKGKTH